MSYIQLFASSPDWLVSAEYFVYRNDDDKLSEPKWRAALNEISDLAKRDQTIVTIHTICHHHIQDGRKCDCDTQHNHVQETQIDYRKGNRNV